jgi:steroid 5-alpha reductase family enzyme
MGILISAALLTFGLQFGGFVVAAILQTEVFYDILGGINFLSLAYLGYDSSSGKGASTLLQYTTAVFVLSRGWLLVFLAWRAYHRKGDSRFDNVKNHPPIFFVYWMVQACWVYLISMPLLVIQCDNNIMAEKQATSLTSTETFLLAGFAFAAVMEIMSDIQKTQWIQRGREGGFCTDGWWSLSRHPNYAGEILQWSLAAILAVVGWSGGGGASSTSVLLPWVSLVSPLFTMQILLTMSGTGVWNAEGKNLKRYYKDDKVRERYIQYRAKTPPVFPTPFYDKIPMPIKRILCFEWERYEYQEK